MGLGLGVNFHLVPSCTDIFTHKICFERCKLHFQPNPTLVYADDFEFNGQRRGFTFKILLVRMKWVFFKVMEAPPGSLLNQQAVTMVKEKGCKGRHPMELNFQRQP